MVAVPYDENGNPIGAATTPRAVKAVPYDDQGNPLPVGNAADQGQAKPPDGAGDYSLARLLHLPEGVLSNTPAVDEADRIAGYPVRAGLHALGGIPDLVSSSVQGFGLPQAKNSGDYSLPALFQSGHGVPEGDMRPVWRPSEAMINATGVGPRPDQSQAGRFVDAALPWAFPTGAQLAKVGEASGPLQKLMTFGWGEAGNAADFAGSELAQEYAKSQGWSPTAQMLMGLAGSQGRQLAGATVARVVPFLGNKEAGPFYDAARKLGFTPPVSDVSDRFLRGTVEGLNAIPGSGVGENAAQAVQKAEIAKTYDKGVKAIDPDAPSVTEGNPATLNAYSEDLSKRAQDQMVAERQAARDTSNRLETPMMGEAIDAVPILQAMDAVINGTGGTLAKTSAQHLKDQLLASMEHGPLTFDALKEARSNIKNEIDRRFPVQTGVATTSRQIGEKIEPIETAMTAGLQGVADAHGVGPEWKANDAQWSQNARDLHALQPTAGKLQDAGGKIDPATGQPRDPVWASTPNASSVAEDLRSGVAGNIQKIKTLDRGMPGEGDSAIAQVLAAQGTPMSGGESGLFRPDRLAVDYPKNVGEGAKERIRQGPGGPEALQNLEDAAEASKSTVRGREPGSLGRILGGIAEAGKIVGAHSAVPIAAGVLGGPLGLAAAPLARVAVHSLFNNPSFVRMVAGRRITADNIGELMAQYARQAGLSQTTPQVDVGSGLKSAASALPSWGSVVSPLVETLTGRAAPPARR